MADKNINNSNVFNINNQIYKESENEIQNINQSEPTNESSKPKSKLGKFKQNAKNENNTQVNNKNSFKQKEVINDPFWKKQPTENLNQTMFFDKDDINIEDL